MPVDEIEQDCRVEAILKPDDTITLDLVHTFSRAYIFIWSVECEAYHTKPYTESQSCAAKI